jgi:hypothetical protein
VASVPAIALLYLGHIIDSPRNTFDSKFWVNQESKCCVQSSVNLHDQQEPAHPK